MDAAQVVTQEVDKFAGLTFGEACLMMFDVCKSTAPSSEGFQVMIDFIAGVHEAMGVEFDYTTYWSDETINGTHEVFEPGLGHALNVVPDVLTDEYLTAMIEKLGALEAANSVYRTSFENVRHRTQVRNNVLIDTRRLQAVVNSVPVYLPVAEESEEDDFI